MNKPKQLDLFIPESEGEPPSTNRGVTVSIHWLSLTFFSDIKTPMSHFLRKFLCYDFEDDMDWSEHFFNTKRGARGYQALYMGPEQVRLYGYPYDGKHCHLEIPGQVLELYGTEHAIKYLKSLFEQNFSSRCTRIDIAFDQVPFTPKYCYEAWKRGYVITKCHKDSWDWHENKEGNTLYIGSRKSERFIRIYDRRGFTRLEMVFKDRWAENLAHVITEIKSNEWIRQCIGYLMDYVSFEDEKSNLLIGWREFIGNSEKINISINKEVNENIKIKLERYFETLIPTLYIIRHGLNKNLNNIVDNSLDKLTSKHLYKLKLICQKLN